MSAPVSPSSAAPKPFPAFWLLLGLVVLLIAAGSLFLSTSLSRRADSRRAALPVLGQPDLEFTATERGGEEKNLASLRGKAVVLAYTYTRCARGCAGVAVQMLKLRDRFAGDPGVHFVCIAAWPEVDTAPMLRAYAESLGVRAEDPWWWLSTERDKTWAWMSREAGFEPSSEISPAERLNPEDVVAHDLRAVLIDPEGRVRAFYQLMHPQTEIAGVHLEKLERDIQTVLGE